jgi:hypothetical protein
LEPQISYHVDHHDQVAAVAPGHHRDDLPEAGVGLEDVVQVGSKVGEGAHKEEATEDSAPDVPGLVFVRRIEITSIEARS